MSVRSALPHRPALPALLLCLALASGEPVAPVLLVAGPDSHGWGAHEHRAGVQLLADALNASGLGVRAAVHQGSWPEDPAVLGSPKAIVIYCDGDGGHVLHGHVDAATSLYRKGVSLVCLHYALEVGEDTLGPLFLDWLGGYFEVDWSVNPTWTPERAVLSEHPVCRGVGTIEITDEWYYHMRFRPGMAGVTAVLSAVPPVTSLSSEDGPRSGNATVREAVGRGVPQHLAWATQNVNGTRGFGFTGGHFHRNWADDNVRKLVLNGIVWAAGVPVPAGGVASGTPDILRYETLLKAVSKGDAEDVERHVRAGADVNERTKVGWVPLHYAVMRRKAEAALVLIRHGADVNAATGKGKTALHMCAERNFLTMANLLIDNGADLAGLDHSGWSALHTAAARNRVDMAKLLLASGANVNARSTAGGTPLHEAAASAGEELIRLLLEKGVDRSVVAENGKTALDCARELGNDIAVRALQAP